MAFIRRVRTASGATAVQVAEYAGQGRQRIVKHLGSAHTEAELGLLLEQARELLADPSQGLLPLEVEPTPAVAGLVPEVGEPLLFDVAGRDSGIEEDRVARGAGRDRPGRVVATGSRLLYEALTAVYDELGFDVLGDETFRSLVVARIVEPTSLLDSARVLADLGVAASSYSTMKRTLRRVKTAKYRDQIAARCFAHALSAGDVSLCLYDVTTLYFEAENEDAFRKVGYSKERRIDPQIVVGLLVDRQGFPLEIGCFEGDTAETTTIVPIIEQFADRHGIADMVIVADAGMLSAKNLTALDGANLRFIVGSRTTKAPIDLASHFRWHGDAFTDGQIIDTTTPKNARVIDNDELERVEPIS
ncbi:IS1634 family transposase [Nocardioides sp.]|uniref:IS1634 family transposase n=1 Tax=Nocardioides sp. TaxID=35761 RepID=UPI0039E66A5C